MSVPFLLRIFLLPMYRPVRGLSRLLASEKRVLYAVLIFLFLGTIYTISVQLAYVRGIVPQVTPFIKIDISRYYFYQRFWQIPFFFITTILFAGVVRLLSISVSGSGRFEDIFAILCVAQTLPMFLLMWIPETIEFLFFPGAAIYPPFFNISRQIIGVVWPLVITVIGIRMNEKIPWYFASLFTLIASIPMTAMMVFCIR